MTGGLRLWAGLVGAEQVLTGEVMAGLKLQWRLWAGLVGAGQLVAGLMLEGWALLHHWW